MIFYNDLRALPILLYSLTNTIHSYIIINHVYFKFLSLNEFNFKFLSINEFNFVSGNAIPIFMKATGFLQKIFIKNFEHGIVDLLLENS